MYKPRIEVVFGNERIISPSGLNIVGAMLGKSDFKKRCDRRKVDPKRSQPQIKDGDVLLTYGHGTKQRTKSLTKRQGTARGDAATNPVAARDCTFKSEENAECPV